LTSPPIPRRGSAEVPVIARVPWSVLGPDFIASWGRPRSKQMPEHLEVLGPTGSGKSYLLVDILRERVRRRGTSVVYIATKQADDTIKKLGWPITDSWRDVAKHDQVVFWPRTKEIGVKRKQYQAAKVQDLLDRLWQPEANTDVVFDEAAYIEKLSAELKATLEMYLREGRSHGIECVMGKQRTQGIQRDMHSETDWKIAFRMNDYEDNERLAQLFGAKRSYVPVLESLDRERHEFLIQHKLDGSEFISWVDRPLAPAPAAPARSAGYLRSRT
jgi:nucleoside-triphosphatase THEP1